MTALRMSVLSPELLEQARERYASVQDRIAGAARRAGRDPAEITLVGIAKKQPLERTLATIGAGLRVLGQSYVQEARTMHPQIEAALAADPTTGDFQLEWHMVGRLQRNKAALATRLFDVVESVDRPELADALARRAEASGTRLDVLVQVSLCDEPQKGGCEPDGVNALVRRILDLPNLRLAGLMTVPASNPDGEAARPIFRRLFEMRHGLVGLDPNLAKSALSMGMSGDFEVAVEEGATLVRVGTALFGERVVPQ
jgi:pyridoxal phosphate enzyme (YggS family)